MNLSNSNSSSLDDVMDIVAAHLWEAIKSPGDVWRWRLAEIWMRQAERKMRNGA